MYQRSDSGRDLPEIVPCGVVAQQAVDVLKPVVDYFLTVTTDFTPLLPTEGNH